MNIVGVIPARYASTRFPGKPLIDIDGQTMIERVYKQAKKAKELSAVLVATDDERIMTEVARFGGEAVFTQAHHPSGTDRCNEVLGIIDGIDALVNIQGDEPFIDPLQIDQVAQLLRKPEVDIATLVSPITTYDVLFDANKPKVVVDANGKALLFSRQVIPHIRGVVQEQWLHHYPYLRHVGIYGYKSEVLKAISQLPISSLEKAESLEQLRWLQAGYSIYCGQTLHDADAIDSPTDLLNLLNKIRHGKL